MSLNIANKRRFCCCDKRKTAGFPRNSKNVAEEKPTKAL